MYTDRSKLGTYSQHYFDDLIWNTYKNKQPNDLITFLVLNYIQKQREHRKSIKEEIIKWSM